MWCLFRRGCGGGELIICWLGAEALWACLFCFVRVGCGMGGSHCVSKSISRFIYWPGCKTFLVGGGGGGGVGICRRWMVQSCNHIVGFCGGSCVGWSTTYMVV